MFKRVLIANRGEIALRILRACRELGVEAVAAYSREDETLLHLDLVDDAICIGAGGAATSYLDINNVLMAALTSGCDAIHPGYGFLAENGEFARRAAEAGLTFIGPAPELLERMGDKEQAKLAATEGGLSVLPSASNEELAKGTPDALAERIGLPLIVKATAGGGGRGMRIVERADGLADAVAAAAAEAGSAFGDPRVYLERYLAGARHVEIQVLGDSEGRAVHLGSRDCSVQRRYQKLLEEAPAPDVPSGALQSLAERCAAATASMGYCGAGTFEFLYANGEFHFIEMNTRLQVEHPVTEMVTGIDIVKEQIRVASGAPLGIVQEEVTIEGHAIECRINAEDAAFNPSPGRVTTCRPPGGVGVRLDSHLYSGYSVPHLYDSLIAKVICHGRDRAEAIARMARALTEYRIEGIETNLPLHRELVADASFRSADHYGRTLE